MSDEVNANAGEVRPWDFFNPKEQRSDQEEFEYRMDICRQCEFFLKRIEQCSKCGCFMKLKTQIKRAHCPIGKW